MEKSLGAVAPGFYADIVAVDGDPLANITAVSKTENIRCVMKAGRVVVDKTKRTERANRHKFCAWRSGTARNSRRGGASLSVCADVLIEGFRAHRPLSDAT